MDSFGTHFKIKVMKYYTFDVKPELLPIWRFTSGPTALRAFRISATARAKVIKFYYRPRFKNRSPRDRIWSKVLDLNLRLEI